MGALSTHHDLHLWLPHPSDGLWRALADVHDAIPRREDTSHRQVGTRCWTPLAGICASCSAACPPTSAPTNTSAPHHVPTRCSAGCSPTSPRMTVRPRAATLRRHRPLGSGARCHGPARQVDVLREVLLGLLADDPTLEPRDILVMCPDIETYAPLIVADFGLGDVLARRATPRTGCAMRLADRSLVQTNPLLAWRRSCSPWRAAGRRPARCSTSPRHAPVRARFGFTDDDLEDITRWVRQSNVRWGFDQEHRAPYGVRLRAQHMAFRHRPRAGRRRDVRRRARLDRHRRCRWTTSAATASNSPGSSPSSSTGCSGRSSALDGARPLRDWLARADRRHHAC